MKKGKLIVIEGTDCSGKETQVKRAVARFKEMGLNIIIRFQCMIHQQVELSEDHI